MARQFVFVCANGHRRELAVADTVLRYGAWCQFGFFSSPTPCHCGKTLVEEDSIHLRM
jgi:hypothetical protein